MESCNVLVRVLFVKHDDSKFRNFIVAGTLKGLGGEAEVSSRFMIL